MELVDEGTGATGRGSEEGRVRLQVSEATLGDTGRVQGGAERDRAAPTPLRPQGSRAGAGAGGGGSAGGLGWGPVATWAPTGGVPPDGGDPALPRGLGRPARRPGRVVTPVEARGSTVQAFAGPRRRPLCCPCGPERARRHRSVNRARFSREASSSCFSPSLKNTNSTARHGRAGPPYRRGWPVPAAPASADGRRQVTYWLRLVRPGLQPGAQGAICTKAH